MVRRQRVGKVVRFEIEIPLGLEDTNNVFVKIIMAMDAREQRFVRLPMVSTEQCTM
jgi:hypothetical protein